jgi:hypothetical protein
MTLLPPDIIDAINTAKPETQLDWALHWAKKGLKIFPCVEFLGKWWSLNPHADIAAVPDLSGHFVILAVGERGLNNLARLEIEHGDFKPEIMTWTCWGDFALWFPGTAVASRNKLADRVHVVGPGGYVFMQNSAAPYKDSDFL